MKEIEFVGTISKMGKNPKTKMRVAIVPKSLHDQLPAPGKQVRITISEV